MQVYQRSSQDLYGRFNVTTQKNHCPFLRTCREFKSLEDCNFYKDAGKVVSCIQGIANKTVEYLREYKTVYRQVCHHQPNSFYLACMLTPGKNREYSCNSPLYYDRICEQKPYTYKVDTPTGLSVEGPTVAVGVEAIDQTELALMGLLTATGLFALSYILFPKQTKQMMQSVVNFFK